ncbi:MAG: SUMF1/EgtB/PvdO family nonheme iron enzyme, partial [Myxococcales bacterium]|nr:SUMF1/EgtB/PvdO family nonheme iron enzyme [Myxococcales bacterium]
MWPRTLALLFLSIAPGACGLDPLDSLPAPPVDAEVALPPADAALGGGCAIEPQLLQADPCTTEIAGALLPFALVERGAFCMGRPAGCSKFLVDQANERLDDASPFRARRVEITRSFHLMRTEVTRQQWQAIVDAEGDRSDYRWPTRPPGDVCLRDDCPVHGLSWSAAAAFANLASRAAGRSPCYRLARCRGEIGSEFFCETVDWPDRECPGYRLPTEAEWEYAARLDSASIFFPTDLRCPWVPIGCDVDDPSHALLATVARFCADVPEPVAERAGPHPLGLRDVLGNVAEWTYDVKLPYARLGDIDPLGEADASQAEDFERVVRGGSWRRPVEFVNVIRRASFADDEISADEVGLRLAVTFDAERPCAADGGRLPMR